MKNWKRDSTIWRTVFDLKESQRRIKEIEKKMGDSDFWKDNSKASELNRESIQIKEKINWFEGIEKETNDLKVLNSLAKEDETIFEGVEKKLKELENKIDKEEIKIFLSGKYDKNNAIMEIFSGAGGVDAQDWATIMLRMYEKYCAKKGFETEIIEQSFGEGGGPEGRIGLKSATVEIKGNYAYGFLKRETGVHRLVRQSPFSSKELRHTSFVLISAMPELSKKDREDIKIKDEDIRIDTYRSSGPGGQNVNKRESAVRVTHIPTGIVASSQIERLQGMNKERAMGILYSKLNQLKESEREKELKNIKGEEISASWGNQIRSYVLHPYKMIKDLRTKVETSDTAKVLDGDLDEFIEREIKLK
ncbi:MAG: peptide chain release factor 2 [Candidatus Nealsonbacteria bacterium]|nr:peptide chain release factor 2 [Candidatus Nealsonbacteria bacterium]